MPSIRAALDRWQVAGFLAALALALAVAAVIKRKPADFSMLPPIAVVRDSLQRPLWTVRVARAAHQIAVDAIAAPPPPEGHAYQLWLAGSDGAHSLGLLPAAGRRVIPEIPAIVARLGVGGGDLIVTLEAARGSDTTQPSRPVRFRAPFPAVIPGRPRVGQGRQSRIGCTTVPSVSR